MGRYNRYYRPRRQGSAFTAFIIVIILAVAAGYVGTKYFVYPYLIDNNKNAAEENTGESPETKTTTEAGVDAISSMPSVIIDQQDIKDAKSATGESIITDKNPSVTPEAAIAGKGPFSVQFGSFSTKAAAEELSAQLTQKGIYSYVFESGGNHKVLGLPYADKEKANQAASIVSAAASDAFVVDLSTLMK